MAIDECKLSAEKLKELELHDSEISENYENVREKNTFSKFYQDYWIEEMLNLVDSKHTDILDYCCGTSIFYPFADKKFENCKYVGVDLSGKMLEIGMKRFKNHGNFSVSQEDGENLTLASESFDLAAGRGAIHHLPHPEKGIQELYKVLRKDGVLLLSEPSSNFLIKSFRKLLYKKNKHFSGVHQSFTNSELQSLVRDNGFEIVKTKRFGLLAFPFGFPDIVPLLGKFPYSFLRFLVFLDKILLKIPFINAFNWNLIIVARKK